jgi:energy-coupling factor transporter ATP-binding protein EcfA2
VGSSDTDGTGSGSVVRRATSVVERTLAVEPTLGRGRLVCVDGPAGVGKSTLAAAVVAATPSRMTTRLVHVDDLLQGWTGLADVADGIRTPLLEPLAAGRIGGYRRYDWRRAAPAEWCPVEPVDLLCLEGVGAWSPTYAGLVTTLVWVDVPEPVRRERVGRREGAEPSWWAAWREAEARLHREQRTRRHADLRIEDQR